MNIISRIKQEFNYKVYDPNRIIEVYQVIQQTEKLVCITIHQTKYGIWLSSDGVKWDRIYGEDDVGKTDNEVLQAVDAIILSMLFMNVMVELMDISIINQINLPQKMPFIKLYCEPFYRLDGILINFDQLKCTYPIKLFIGRRKINIVQHLNEEITEFLLSLPFEVVFFCEF